MLDFANSVIFIFIILMVLSSSHESQDDDHECLRPCSNEQSSKKICRYEFAVSELLIVNCARNKSRVKDEVSTCEGNVRSFLGINGKSPGPSIEICSGDTIEVVVYNKLGTEELSLHWHGLRQKGSVHMDGVAMVTQCSILPYGGFRYRIKPETIGTYFYHAHSVSQQADGVYGSLTVRGPQDESNLERILLLSSRPPTPLIRRSLLYPPTPKELLINGQNGGTVLKVNHGSQYLLRLINANSYNCPIILSTSGHAFRVLATDGNLVQSMTATHTVLFPGERLDVILRANKSPGKYLIDINGLEDCQGLRQKAFILYDDGDLNSTLIKDGELLELDDYDIINKGYNCHEISKNVVCALDFKSLVETTEKIKAEEVIYIPFDVNVFPSFTDEMTDNRYNFYENTFYPSYLSLSDEDIKVVQIDGVTFKYPSSPILSQPESTPEASICSFEKRATHCTQDTPLFCECIQIIDVPVRKMVEIVLIDEGFGGNSSHTFHVHGYNVSIMGRGSFERPITKEEVLLLDRAGKLFRNFANPPQKDSFVVPNKGYVILRFYTDNLGYWLWEARGTAISPGTFGPGMQFLMRVGSQESFQPVPLNFPACGNNKGPDMIFHTI